MRMQTVLRDQTEIAHTRVRYQIISDIIRYCHRLLCRQPYYFSHFYQNILHEIWTLVWSIIKVVEWNWSHHSHWIFIDVLKKKAHLFVTRQFSLTTTLHHNWQLWQLKFNFWTYLHAIAFMIPSHYHFNRYQSVFFMRWSCKLKKHLTIHLNHWEKEKLNLDYKCLKGERVPPPRQSGRLCSDQSHFLITNRRAVYHFLFQEVGWGLD